MLKPHTILGQKETLDLKGYFKLSCEGQMNYSSLP